VFSGIVSRFLSGDLLKVLLQTGQNDLPTVSPGRFHPSAAVALLSGGLSKFMLEPASPVNRIHKSNRRAPDPSSSPPTAKSSTSALYLGVFQVNFPFSRANPLLQIALLLDSRAKVKSD
jgi:hypothetical protein